MEGHNMPSNVQDLRPRIPDTEKITVNLGYVDLGQVDLLVREGFYSNRTDFIRTAIRNQLGTHGDVLKQKVARRSMTTCRRSSRHRPSPPSWSSAPCVQVQK